MELPLKGIFRGGHRATVLPCAVRGGVLVELPLIERVTLPKIISILVKTTFKLADVTIYKLKQTSPRYKAYNNN